MSNLLNLSDSINFAISTGKTPTFIYNGVTYEFSPQGLIDFITAQQPEPPFVVPTNDPEVAGQVWNNDGVLVVSEGPSEPEEE